MARSKHGKNARPSVDCANGPIAGQSKPKSHINNAELTHEAINRHWDAIPPQAKTFILDANDGMFPLSKLVKFWSNPHNVESTRGDIACRTCGALWYLALVYIKLGRFKEARALTMNGAFIHQCYNSSIEDIKTVSESTNLTNSILQRRLPCLVDGFDSARSSPDIMESYIRSYLPKEYTQMMTTYANLSTNKKMRGYIDQISDDWKGSSSKNGHHQSPSSTDDTTQIKLLLVDDANEDERHSFDIGASTTLKALFNDYADYRGISLRLLRFSYAENTLFLSSAGHKTPEDLSMQDGDVIKVHDTSTPEEQSCDGSSSSSQSRRSTSKKSKAKKRSNKKAKVKNKKPQQQEKPTMTLEEHKVQHSKQLTKIHEEAQTQFKQIRQRLNNLIIVRSQPKTKSKRPRTHKPEPSLPSMVDIHLKEGGKAGKSHYTVHVGAVENLYKTTKPNAMLASHLSASAPLETLDLHGCTRKEALIKLNESLKVWVDAAMQGSYPFVQSAVIVCGCGNQILSEVTSNWIRSNHKVSNAPQLKSSMRRGIGLGFAR